MYDLASKINNNLNYLKRIIYITNRSYIYGGNIVTVLARNVLIYANKQRYQHGD